MESLNVYNNNNSYREYKYPAQVSAILMTEYIHDGYFQVEDTDIVLLTEREAALGYAMSKLRPRERFVIDRFANAKPGSPWLSELAADMGVIPLRIKQIQEKAFRKLRYYLRKEKKVDLWLEETDEEEEVS